ncbi:MAG: DUF3465 domain-containing protein [Bdellovibrionaceae bacterium]|nr:DUF3465 domain-containing protein [Pseudobdellovibrionaceae bacterium]
MKSFVVGFVLCTVFASVSAQAVYPEDFKGFAHEATVTDDRDLVKANRDRRTVRFLRAANLTVTKLMPDDTQGSRHQRFYAKLSDASEVYIVYSLEYGRVRVPVTVGSRIGVGGEYRWTKFGGLLHWVHEDHRDQRPDGYVEVRGVRYGKDR